MRFQVTMNMGSFSGNPVHQVICEHPANSLDEFMDILDGFNYIMVEEWYRHNETKEYYATSKIILNTSLIGKVKVFK